MLEILIEFIIEGAMEGAASKSIPKSLRYFLFGLIVTVFSLVIAVLFYLGIRIPDTAVRVCLIGSGVIIAAVLIKFTKEVLAGISRKKKD